jgi:hypothetical protein
VFHLCSTGGVGPSAPSHEPDDVKNRPETWSYAIPGWAGHALMSQPDSSTTLTSSKGICAAAGGAAANPAAMHSVSVARRNMAEPPSC